MNIWGKRLRTLLLMLSLMSVLFGCTETTTDMNEGETWQARLSVASEPERRLEWQGLAGTMTIKLNEKIIESSKEVRGSFSLDEVKNETITVEIIPTSATKPQVNYIFIGMAPTAVTVTKPLEFTQVHP